MNRKKLAASAAAILIAGLPLVHPRADQTPAPAVTPADLVLRGGKMVTVDDARPEAEALAAAGDTIVAVVTAREQTEATALHRETEQRSQQSVVQSAFPFLCVSV